MYMSKNNLQGNASPLELLIGLKDEHRVIDDTEIIQLWKETFMM